MIIYRIVNQLNGMTYIGQTVRALKTRINGHKKASSYLGNSIRKYGIDNFHIEELDTAKSIDELNAKEEFYIEHFNCLLPNGFNVKTGGGNGVSVKLHKQIKRIDPSTNEVTIYQSVIVAAEMNGICKAGISYSARNFKKKFLRGGYLWQFVNSKVKDHTSDRRVRTRHGLEKKPIVLEKDNKIYSFESQRAAAKHIGCSPSLFSMLHSGRVKTVKGYKKC